MNQTAISKSKTRDLSLIALMTAVTCILAPMTISIPFTVIPLSLANFAILFSVYLLGQRKGVLSCVLYLLIGLAGLPVFSGFSGGPGKLFGPTGGYLAGYLFLVWISGWFFEHFPGKRTLQLLGMTLGTAALYFFGTLWYAMQAGVTFGAALSAAVLPFIPGDLCKMFLVLLIGEPVKKALQRAGLD